MSEKSLYERLGGYHAVAGYLPPRLRSDPRLRRFCDHRGADGMAREKPLLIDFLCSSAGGPVYCAEWDIKTSHIGMCIGASDWSGFVGHLEATLDAFGVPRRERDDGIGLVRSTESDIVEA